MKITCLISILMICGLHSSYAQSMQTTPPATGKTNQASLFNDLYGGYGAGSIFYFTGRMSHTSDYPTEWRTYHNKSVGDKKYTMPSSAGTFLVGYGRTLNSVVSMGFMFGLQSFSYTGTDSYLPLNGSYGDSSLVRLTNNDILLTGIARVLFSYVNRPAIRLYSGIGIGITVNFGKAKLGTDEYSEHRLWPGGQLTLMGLRFGRKFGGFFEFGFGSFGIINAGVSYKFKD